PCRTEKAHQKMAPPTTSVATAPTTYCSPRPTPGPQASSRQTKPRRPRFPHDAWTTRPHFRHSLVSAPASGWKQIGPGGDCAQTLQTKLGKNPEPQPGWTFLV